MFKTQQENSRMEILKKEMAFLKVGGGGAKLFPSLLEYVNKVNRLFLYVNYYSTFTHVHVIVSCDMPS